MNGFRSTRFTVLHVLWLSIIAICTTSGLVLGLSYLGTFGLIVCGVIGFGVGYAVSSLLDWLLIKSWFREVERSSNAELRSAIAVDDWMLGHTMALLQLAARREEVHSELPRILGMLKSDSHVTRAYGWDALRIVFPKETKIIEHYNPRESTEDCRNKVARLKATSEETVAPTPTD